MPDRRLTRRGLLGTAAAALTARRAVAEAGDVADGTLREAERQIPLAGTFDVLVCGGGPAGIAAAIAATRAGASVQVLDVNGCLGGVWTAGLLSYVLDGKQTGVNAELVRRLAAVDGVANDSRVLTQPAATVFDSAASHGKYLYQAEAMKVVLDDWLHELGVGVQLHTRVVDVVAEPEQGGDGQPRVVGVVTESKSGRQAWRADVVIDATGDGDVGALAGCDWQFGRDRACPRQPMSLMGFVSGDPKTFATYANNGADGGTAKDRLREAMAKAGVEPSYGKPTLWHWGGPVAAVMVNHEYGVVPFDAAAVSEATRRARHELFTLTKALRDRGGEWTGLQMIATAEQIGIRDGRRIRGRYEVTVDDVATGQRHADAICTSTFAVDIHAPTREANKMSAYDNGGVKAQPFDIPLRALIARDVDGLMMAGRCISGDFYAHASYRVTGNAVAMGEAAGITAAIAAEQSQRPHEVAFEIVQAERLRQDTLIRSLGA